MLFFKSKLKYFGLNYYLLLKLLIYLGFAEKIYWMNNKIFFKNILFIKLDRLILDKYLIEVKLRDKIYIDIRKYKVLFTYKGYRHLYSLPVHGQRTKTNANTNKKKK